MASLLIVVIGSSALGQTVLYDFQDFDDPFGHFGTVTIDGTVLADCGTVGNVCASHTGRFTEINTSPHEIGMIEIGPFSGPTAIDLTPFVGYSIDARFIRDTDGLGGAGNELFTGLSPIKFGVQWDTSDDCPGSMNACSDLYAAPVELTESFQTYTVLFEDFLMGKPRGAAQIKMLMLTGDFDPDAAPNKKLSSGDFNANSHVGGEDLLTWQRNFARTDGGTAVRFSAGNANIDGIIDGVDLGIWAAQFGTAAPIADWSDGVGRLEFDNIIGILPSALAAARAVPEPSSCWLVLCGVPLLLCRSRN
jgi:hypothetical protein